MTPALILDVVLLLLLVGYVVGMYRTGLVAGVLSIAGMVAGGLLALWGLPGPLQDWSATAGDPRARVLFLVVGTIGAAALGQQLGAVLGWSFRSRLTHRPSRALDSVLGGVAALVVGASLVWFVASAALGALPSPPRALADSRVLHGIDRVMPDSADRALSSASADATAVLPTPPLPPTKRTSRCAVRSVRGEVMGPSGTRVVVGRGPRRRVGRRAQQQEKWSSGDRSMPIRRCQSWNCS